MKKVAILQSNYIPWKGYFDIINMVDEFIVYDETQYTKRDWRNRNQIKTSSGKIWLSIPVKVKGKYTQKISDTKIQNLNWREKHWQSIILNYTKAKFFKEFKDIFENLYLDSNEFFLSDINLKFINAINKILDIKTTIKQSSDFELKGNRSKKLLNICKDCNAEIYLSGPAAKSYIDEDIFKQENIQIEWMDYSNYPEYKQLYPPFIHQVSIIDLIFNEGKNAKNFMKSFKDDSI